MNPSILLVEQLVRMLEDMITQICHMILRTLSMFLVAVHRMINTASKRSDRQLSPCALTSSCFTTESEKIKCEKNCIS